LSWIDLAGEGTGTGKSGSRVKYTCPDCAAAVWGKGGLRLACLECDVELEPVD